MHLAAHGWDAVFLVIAAIAFILAAFSAVAFVEPRVMKAIYACIALGLLFMTLASLIAS